MRSVDEPRGEEEREGMSNWGVTDSGPGGICDDGHRGVSNGAGSKRRIFGDYVGYVLQYLAM